MKELMTSSRSSKATTLTLLLVLALTAVAPAAAVSVASEDVPREGEVGTTVEATFTLDTLYQDPAFTAWTLQGETDLRNVTWIVAYKDPSGSVFDQQQYNGQTFDQPGIDAESGTAPFDSPVTEIEITVRGEVPQVEAYTYDDRESFLLAGLSQEAGDTGSTNQIGEWGTYHYTTGGEDSPGTQQARTQIGQAETAIDEARAAGADTSQANQTLESAISAYDSGNFENAVRLANNAEESAVDAQESAESSAQTRQLLIYAGLAVLVIALLGGGYWYYQSQQDTYDKLG